MAILRYPLDLGRADKKYPYVGFRAVKYKDRSFVVTVGANNDDVDSSKNSEKITEGSFYLPLPNDVANAYNMNWEMADLRGVQAIVDLFTSENLADGAMGVPGDLAGILFDKSAQIFARKTPNPKKQALFKGIDPRTFSFTYTFTPQSLQEAETIQQIIRDFTYYSLPSLENENSSFFQFPHEFEIKFFNVEGFPKISPCVCTAVSTNYSPNTMSLLKDGHTVQTSITLTFLETELLRKQKPGI